VAVVELCLEQIRFLALQIAPLLLQHQLAAALITQARQLLKRLLDHQPLFLVVAAAAWVVQAAVQGTHTQVQARYMLTIAMQLAAVVVMGLQVVTVQMQLTLETHLQEPLAVSVLT
jgi:hypothetical protein